MTLSDRALQGRLLTSVATVALLFLHSCSALLERSALAFTLTYTPPQPPPGTSHHLPLPAIPSLPETLVLTTLIFPSILGPQT